MPKVRVIAGEKDGAELGRETRKERLSVRCDGKNDGQEINEALEYSGKPRPYCIDGAAWQRVFGGQHG